jgi:hypothetical protein
MNIKVNNATNISRTDNHLSLHSFEQKKQDIWLGNPGSCLGQEQECGGVLYPEFHSFFNKNGK